MRNQPFISNRTAGILLLISSVLLLTGAALRLVGIAEQSTPFVTAMLIALAVVFGWLGYLKIKE